MASRCATYADRNFDVTHFANEDDLKAALYSVEVRTPKIKENIRDKSCIVIFPKNTNQTRLNRVAVSELMKQKWGELFEHVVHFGNVDFSRKWIFSFDTHENNERAITKEIFVNEQRIKAFHATKKYNHLKIDWVPPFTDLDDLAKVIGSVPGVTGKFVDIRWARGDKIDKDSTQVIMRFYDDVNENFAPPSYIHYNDEYGYRVFLHLTVIGNTNKCMRCNREGHIVANCPLFFCYGCGKLTEKEKHDCPFPKYKRNNERNFVNKENGASKSVSPNKASAHTSSYTANDQLSKEKSKSEVSFSEVVNRNKHDRKYDTLAVKGNMEFLKKHSLKGRTPPTPPTPPNPKTPQFTQNIVRASTPVNRINFSGESSSLNRESQCRSIAEIMSSIPPPSELDPKYLKEFPKMIDKSFPKNMGNRITFIENEEEYLTDDELENNSLNKHHLKINNLSEIEANKSTLEKSSYNINITNDWSEEGTTYY